VLRHPVFTISLIGLVLAQALILARTTRLQLPWADPSPKRRLSRIINLHTFGSGPTASCLPMNYWEIIADSSAPLAGRGVIAAPLPRRLALRVEADKTAPRVTVR